MKYKIIMNEIMYMPLSRFSASIKAVSSYTYCTIKSLTPMTNLPFLFPFIPNKQEEWCLYMMFCPRFKVGFGLNI